MSTSQHPIEREELMAFLDGELPAERAASAAEHLKRCTECQKLARDLQQVSQALVSWEVEPAGSEIPASIAVALDEKASRQKTAISRRWAFRKFVAWPQFAWAGGLAAATLLVIAISVPNLLKSRFAANEPASIKQVRAVAEARGEQTALSQATSSPTRTPRQIAEEPTLSNYISASSGRVPRKSRTKGADVNGNLLSAASSVNTQDAYSYYQLAPGSAVSPPPPVPMAKPLPRRAEKFTVTATAPATTLHFAAHGETSEKQDLIGGVEGSGKGHATPGKPTQSAVEVDTSAEEITGPMVIRTAELALTSKDKDFDQAQSRVEEILKRHHGYVGEMNLNTPTGSARSLTATLRVPANQLEATLADLKQMGRVEKESQNGEEVTQQYVDLEARLRNSRNTEQRLIELQRERTGKLSDVLSVEMQISRVRGEIEQMEGQRKAMRNQVDYATLTLTISEDYKAELKVVPPSTGTLIRNAAVDGYRSLIDGLLGLLLWLLSWLPSLLLWFAVLFFPARYTWRRLKQHFGQRELAA